MKYFKNFVCVSMAILIIAFTVFSCNKENDAVTTAKSESGCDFEYGKKGYIVQENGILNFKDGASFSAFIDTMAQLSDSLFAVWEAGSGANTAYGNYIEADVALSNLMSQYENDTLTTDSMFLPTFNTFKQSKQHLASISAEGVEPYFMFPFYYFVNSDGIYRICDQEYSLQGSLLLSYPVGKEDLIAEWNGEVGEFGELSVQKVQNAKSTSEIHERDEAFEASCTASYDGGKKRIRVFWNSNSFTTQDPVNFPGHTIYHWFHEAEIKAQKKSFFIWWSDTRHISLQVSGTITNRHTGINFLVTRSVEFFRCVRANNIKQLFASDFQVSTVNSNANNFAFNLVVTGNNRQVDCQTIQAACTMNLINN